MTMKITNRQQYLEALTELEAIMFRNIWSEHDRYTELADAIEEWLEDNPEEKSDGPQAGSWEAIRFEWETGTFWTLLDEIWHHNLLDWFWPSLHYRFCQWAHRELEHYDEEPEIIDETDPDMWDPWGIVDDDAPDGAWMAMIEENYGDLFHGVEDD